MIDLHCHLLPGVDDGAPDLAAAERMLDAAAQDGIHTIVCTPHDSGRALEQLAAFPEALTAAAEQRGIRLLPGMEYRYSHLRGEESSLRPLGESSFLLVELGCRRLPGSLEQLFFELGCRGFQLVLAHPERYLDELDACAELERLGVFFQLNVDSVLGLNGSSCRRQARRMLEHGYAHYLASDAHGPHRTFHLSRCREALTADYGADYAELLLRQNPERLLQNLPPLTARATPAARSRGWRRWFRWPGRR